MATNNDHQSSRRGATEVMQQKLELNTQSGHKQPIEQPQQQRNNRFEDRLT